MKKINFSQSITVSPLFCTHSQLNPSRMGSVCSSHLFGQNRRTIWAPWMWSPTEPHFWIVRAFSCKFWQIDFTTFLSRWTSSLILFSNFCCIFSTFPQSLIDILSSFFANFSNFFSQIYSVPILWLLKFVQIFILVYLKNFLASPKSVFNFFFWHSNYFFRNIY